MERKDAPEALKSLFTGTPYPYLWFKVDGKTNGNQISLASTFRILNVPNTGAKECFHLFDQV